MHVVLFFTYDISLSDWKTSGILNRELKIYEEFEKNENIKFTFITYGDFEDKNIISNPNINIIPIYSIFKKSNSSLVRFLKSFSFPFYLKNNLEDFDVIKTNQLHGSWIAIILKYLTKKKLYIRTGFDFYTFAKKRGLGFPKVLFFYFLTKISLKTCEIYSVTSITDKKFLEKKFNPEREIELIRNWVEPIENSEDRFDNRILAVGRLEYQKNFSELFKQLKDTNFFIDIVGSGSLKELLKKEAIENNLTVNFLGNLKHKDLMELYGKYKVFVSSSLYEGNPKALLEAMSMGCVVISNKIENIEEIIIENRNGFLYEFENENLQEKITNVFKNEKKFKKISDEAINFIEKEYSFKSVVEKELKILKLLGT